MSNRDIHIAWKTVMDKNERTVAFGGCPAFTPSEIDLFLNLGYIEVVNTKVTGSNSRLEPFEGSVKRISDLEGLIKTDSKLDVSKIINTNQLVLEGFTGDRNRLFFVEGILHFGDKSVPVNLTDHATAQRFCKSYNNNPWIPIPVATLEDNKLIIYIDDIEMEGPYELDVTYVKYPTKIDHTKYDEIITEVPEGVLYEVINRAVVLALENIESQRTNTKVLLNLMSE